MITVKNLLNLLATLPHEAEVNAYEGEDIGLSIRLGDRYWWIRARPTDEQDDQAEFWE